MDLEQLVASMPFAVHTGVRLEHASPERVVGHLDWDSHRTTVGNSLHGGALMTLADSVGAICAFLNLPTSASTSTTSSSTVFTRSICKGTVTANARPLHSGRSTIAIVTELHDDEGRLVAQVTSSQAVLGP